MVLASLGGAGGVLVAHLTLRLLSAYQLPGGIEIANLGLAIDGRTVTAAAALVILTACLFGLAPAWSGSRGDLIESLRGAGDGSVPGTGAPRSNRRRGTLVTAQVALSLVLLAGTGLFLRGLVHALNTPLGFVPERVARASVNLGLARYTAARAADFYSNAVESVRTIPGVAAAAWGSLIPTNGSMMASVQIEGYVPTPSETPRVLLSQVGPDYFRTLETRILSGRSFVPGDNTSAPRVAIVTETAARTYWSGRDPVGGRLKMDDGEWVTVIGIAEDSILGNLGEEPFPFVYFPFDHDIGFGNLLGPAHLLVRTEGDPADVLPAVRDRLRALDPQVPIFDLHPLSFHIKELLMPQQMGAALFSVFSVLAVSLAIIGIYGVASYVVGIRTREIGIRTALGADRRTIGRLLLLGGLPPIAAGIAIGIGLAMWAARFATALVYGVSPWDPATLVGVTTLLAALALLASYLPARRAAHPDPIVALRQD